MLLNIIKLLFDTGLFILIWMVQLIVYPSFLYYEKHNLLKWHKHYALGLSVIVMPLMFGQLILSLMQSFQLASKENLINFILVISIWIITFLIFVPLHQKIAENKATDALLKQLVTKNWLRTVLWTLIFGWSVYTNFSK